MKPALIAWGVGGALVASFLGTLAWGLTHVAGTQPGIMVGRPMPPMSIRTLEGKELALSDFRGTPLVINFWASWCVPCRQEAPILNSGAREYAGQVQFVGVDIQDSDAAARTYQAEFLSPYPVGPSFAGSYLEWGVRAPPETYFIDRRGVITAKFIGPVDARRLAFYVDRLAA